MNKLFNLTSTFKSHEADDGSVMIRGMASTADFDRAGDSISAEAWTKGGLANFEKNPIILFNHDYDKPIGRATGLKAGPNGLELECKISKAAPANVAQLVKDGVLGAFSVGFRVKDADYLKETDGLMIKDAELFEVSVVSVPCNQSATFSLAKSFDSDEEYNEFKKTFTNRVDLAGQSLAKDEVNTSSIASDAPTSAEEKSADQEIKMDNQNIDLEAFAKQVAEDTAAKIAMKQAEQKAADEAKAKAAQEADEAKALEAESIKSVVNTGVATGVEKLMADVEAKLSEKDASFTEVLGQYKKDLEEKQAEIEAMQQSKKSFSDRGRQDLTKFGKDFLGAHILGKVTGKGFETGFAQNILSKAGADYATSAGDIDQIVSTTFEEEVRLAQQVGGLFSELPVTSGATVLPIAMDPGEATFGAGGLNRTTPDTTHLNGGGGSNQYNVKQQIVNAYRLFAGTYIDNNVDEQIVVSLLPMLTSALSRAHAKAIDKAILFGSQTGAVEGLVGHNGTDDGGSGAVTGSAYAAAVADNSVIIDTDTKDGDVQSKSDERVTPQTLMQMRGQMGKYGINPNDVAFIVPTNVYYDMIDDTGFTDISEVGNAAATKLTGEMGSVFGSRLIVSDQLANTGYSASATSTAAIAVNVNNFIQPRLRGVNIETEYSAVDQRTNLVASQSVGFNRVVADSATDPSAVQLRFV